MYLYMSHVDWNNYWVNPFSSSISLVPGWSDGERCWSVLSFYHLSQARRLPSDREGHTLGHFPGWTKRQKTLPQKVAQIFSHWWLWHQSCECNSIVHVCTCMCMWCCDHVCVGIGVKVYVCVYVLCEVNVKMLVWHRQPFTTDPRLELLHWEAWKCYSEDCHHSCRHARGNKH